MVNNAWVTSQASCFFHRVHNHTRRINTNSIFLFVLCSYCCIILLPPPSPSLVIRLLNCNLVEWNVTDITSYIHGNLHNDDAAHRGTSELWSIFCQASHRMIVTIILVLSCKLSRQANKWHQAASSSGGCNNGSKNCSRKKRESRKKDSTPVDNLTKQKTAHKNRSTDACS